MPRAEMPMSAEPRTRRRSPVYLTRPYGLACRPPREGGVSSWSFTPSRSLQTSDALAIWALARAFLAKLPTAIPEINNII